MHHIQNSTVAPLVLKDMSVCQSGVYTNNVSLFGTIFRHVGLLVIELSRQVQNFQIIRRTNICILGRKAKI